MDSSYNYSSTYSSTTGDGGAFAAVFMVFLFVWLLTMLIMVVPSIVGLWKLFAKAGKPGWAAIVPVYNIVVWCQVVGRPVWWVALFFVPLVNIFAGFALSVDLAKSFGKDLMYGVLTWLFSPVMLPVLAFSKSTQYVGPVAEGTDMFSSFSHSTTPAPAAPQPTDPFAAGATTAQATPDVTPEAAEAPATPFTPGAQATPETPVVPETPVTPETSAESETSATQEAPTTPVAPVGPVVFEVPTSLESPESTVSFEVPAPEGETSTQPGGETPSTEAAPDVLTKTKQFSIYISTKIAGIVPAIFCGQRVAWPCAG